jgi:DNA-binding NarL/FixJ family response regulator
VQNRLYQEEVQTMQATCLIVDDHDDLRKTILDWLEFTFPEVNFIGSVSGEEAVTLARQLNPLVILMDVGLPGISGIEATRQIKKLNPDTFVIMHTIYDDQAHYTDAVSAGADAFILKSKTQVVLIPVLEKKFSAIV